MATIKTEYYKFNSITGEWDLYFFKTSADLIEETEAFKVLTAEERNAIGNADELNRGTVPANRLSPQPGFYNITPVCYGTNILHCNLGAPSLAEMSAVGGEFTNKLWFYDPTKFTFEYTMDGTTWINSTPAIGTIKNLVAGDAVEDLWQIPNGTVQARITIDNSGAYVCLDALYLWASTSDSIMALSIESKKNDLEQWTTHCPKTNSTGNWPGHFWLQHPTITWSQEAIHNNIVRINIFPTWNSDSYNIRINKIQWFGGYPAGKKEIYSWDADKNVFFPAAVFVANKKLATQEFVGNSLENVIPAIEANLGNIEDLLIRSSSKTYVYYVANEGVNYLHLAQGINDCEIDWGDGTKEINTVGGVLSHTYKNEGYYYIVITGNFQGFRVDSGLIVGYIPSDPVQLGARNYRKVWMGNNCQYVGDKAFRGCINITEIQLPNGLENLGASAFSSCSSLIILDNIDELITIGTQAFYNCRSLTDIVIPNTLTSLGTQAFYNCESLRNITLPSASTFNTIPSGAFHYCSSLASILIPDNVTTIESNAFYSCWSLTDITILSSVTVIGSSAFGDCRALISISLPFIGSSVSSTGNASKFWYIFGFSAGSVPSSLKTVIIRDAANLGVEAFANCSYIREIFLPETLHNGTEMGTGVFKNCRRLENIKLPSDVTVIPDAAFENCFAIKSIEIPMGVTAINARAFYSCSGLINILIDINTVLSTIGSNAFMYCNSLSSIILPATLTSIGNSAFSSCRGLREIYYNGTKSNWSTVNNGIFFAVRAAVTYSSTSGITNFKEFFIANSGVIIDSYIHPPQTQYLNSHQDGYAITQLNTDNTGHVTSLQRKKIPLESLSDSNGYYASRFSNVYLSSTLSFPVGTILLVYTGPTKSVRNASRTIYIDNGNNYGFDATETTNVLAGTWRARGWLGGTGDYQLFQRTA